MYVCVCDTKIHRVERDEGEGLIWFGHREGNFVNGRNPISRLRRSFIFLCLLYFYFIIARHRKSRHSKEKRKTEKKRKKRSSHIESTIYIRKISHLTNTGWRVPPSPFEFHQNSLERIPRLLRSGVSTLVAFVGVRAPYNAVEKKTSPRTGDTIYHPDLIRRLRRPRYVIFQISSQEDVPRFTDRHAVPLRGRSRVEGRGSRVEGRGGRRKAHEKGNKAASRRTDAFFLPIRSDASTLSTSRKPILLLRGGG